MGSMAVHKPLSTDEEIELADLCKAIGDRQLECKGHSGALIQDIAIEDVFKFAIAIVNMLSGRLS